MAFTMAALRAQDAVEIRDCANVNTSFPNFVGQARQAGVNVEAAGLALW
jgi:3-phosphoshikimate 1-carboxyvinyltransferase